MKLLYIDNIIKRQTQPLFARVWLELGGDVHIAANLSQLVENLKKPDITYHHIDIQRNPFHPKNYKAFEQMLLLMNSEKYDVVHCNSPIGGVLGRICGTKSNVKTIIYMAHGFHFYKGAPLINNTVYKFAEHLLARKTDVIITITKDDYQVAKEMTLRKSGLGKVFYLPGVGIDVDSIAQTVVDRDRIRAELGIQKHDCMVIAMGRLEKNKNVENMIRAIALIDMPIKLVLCGDGNQRTYLEELSHRLGVNHKVFFAGFRTDISKLLKASDAFLQVSYREGLSRSVMEAMAAGLPCVVSNIRGNVDLIEQGKGGYLVHPKDVTAIAGAIEALSKSRRLRKEMGQWNVARVRLFSEEKVRHEIRIICNEYLLKTVV